MASTFTSLLRLAKQGQGENSNSWGTLLNTLIDLVDVAIAGMVSIATTGGTTTLSTANGTSDEARYAILKITGVLVSNSAIVVPASSKLYTVWNATSGAYTVTVKTSGGSGIAVTQGETMSLFCDGTDVKSSVTDVVTVADVQAGTGVYVATVGGTADAITLTPSPAITAYAAGQTFRWIASGANTTAVTVQVSGIASPKALTKNGTTALVAGDIPSGAMVEATYDGTRFQLGSGANVGSTLAAALGASASAGSSGEASRVDHVHQRQLESIIVAASDETTALATGTNKVKFRMPYAFTVTAVRASLSTAQTSGNIFTVDINDGGTTILSTKLTIDNTETTSTTAAAAVISDTALADDAEISIDIDQIGDGTAKGLKVVLIGRQSA